MLGGPTANRSGDVGRAVLVLAPGIEEEEFPRRDAAIAFAGHAVMHDGAIGPGAGDGGKRDVLEEAGLAAKTLYRLDCVDFGQAAALCFAVEPGEETRHRHAVAPLRRARARDLRRVLHRLHRRDRIAAAQDLAAVVDDESRDGLGTDARIEPHGAMLFAERGEIALEGGARPYFGDLFEALTHVGAEFAQVDEQRRAAVLGDHGEGQRHRRVGNITAADVEQPGDGVRV